MAAVERQSTAPRALLYREHAGCSRLSTSRRTAEPVTDKHCCPGNGRFICAMHDSCRQTHLATDVTAVPVQPIRIQHAPGLASDYFSAAGDPVFFSTGASQSAMCAGIIASAMRVPLWIKSPSMSHQQSDDAQPGFRNSAFLHCSG